MGHHGIFLEWLQRQTDFLIIIKLIQVIIIENRARFSDYPQL